jgi:hypothetical protein
VSSRLSPAVAVAPGLVLMWCLSLGLPPVLVDQAYRGMVTAQQLAELEEIIEVSTWTDAHDRPSSSSSSCGARVQQLTGCRIQATFRQQ